MVDFGPPFFNLKFMEIIERAFSEFFFASDSPREVLGVPGLAFPKFLSLPGTQFSFWQLFLADQSTPPG